MNLTLSLYQRLEPDGIGAYTSGVNITLNVSDYVPPPIDSRPYWGGLADATSAATPSSVPVEFAGGRIAVTVPIVDRRVASPETGVYHDGQLDVTWLSSESRATSTEDFQRTIRTFDAYSRRVLGNTGRDTALLVFTSLDDAVTSAPPFHIGMDTRQIGVSTAPARDPPRPPRVVPDEFPARVETEAVTVIADNEAPVPLGARAVTHVVAPPSGSVPVASIVPAPSRWAVMSVVTAQPLPVPISLATAVVIGGALLIALFVLYSLYHPKDLLRNGVRGKIYEAVEANPGITIARISEIVGVKHQTVSYHLKFLRKAGYVTDMERGNRRLHFVPGAGLSEADRVLLTVANDDSTMAILKLIAENPGIIKRDLGQAMGFTRTATAWHINKLVKLGLIKEKRAHGHCQLIPSEDRYWRLVDLIARGVHLEHLEQAAAPQGATPAETRPDQTQDANPTEAPSANPDASADTIGPTRPRSSDFADPT